MLTRSAVLTVLAVTLGTAVLAARPLWLRVPALAFDPLCVWVGGSQGPLHLADSGGELFLDITSVARSAAGAVAVGTASALYWNLAQDDGVRPVERAAWIGGIITDGGSFTPIPAPFPNISPSFVHVLPTDSAGWDVIWIQSAPESRNEPPRITAIWHGRFDEQQWQSLEQIPIPSDGLALYPFGSVAWRQNDEQVVLALRASKEGELASTGLSLVRHSSSGWIWSHVTLGALTSLALARDRTGNEDLLVAHLTTVDSRLRTAISSIDPSDSLVPIQEVLISDQVTRSIPKLWAIPSEGGSHILWLEPVSETGMQLRWAKFEAQGNALANARSFTWDHSANQWAVDADGNPIVIRTDSTRVMNDGIIFGVHMLLTAQANPRSVGQFHTPITDENIHMVQLTPDSIMLLGIVQRSGRLTTHLVHAVRQCAP